jgi:hypothetical protein
LPVLQEVAKSVWRKENQNENCGNIDSQMQQTTQSSKSAKNLSGHFGKVVTAYWVFTMLPKRKNR